MRQFKGNFDAIKQKSTFATFYRKFWILFGASFFNLESGSLTSITTLCSHATTTTADDVLATGWDLIGVLGAGLAAGAALEVGDAAGGDGRLEASEFDQNGPLGDTVLFGDNPAAGGQEFTPCRFQGRDRQRPISGGFFRVGEAAVPAGLNPRPDQSDDSCLQPPAASSSDQAAARPL